MEVKYETDKKNVEIEMQQSVIARQNMQRRFWAAGVAVCVAFLILLWYMLLLRTRRNRALTEMNATKDKFFSIISHDLKNPALALHESLKLLVRNGRTWDTETLTEYCQELLQSAEGHIELIYSLLDWTRVQTGRMTCKIDTFPLCDLYPAISPIRKMAENKNIALTVSIPDNALVNGDSNILAVVVRNLLTNAVKFTPEGGQVTLDISPVSPMVYTISVSDTGIGMSKEQISHLFHLDRSNSQPGTAGEKGTGLGLIICRDLLEKHGTRLYTESEEGKGSRFWFEI
jgi:signal transduction histidine kinase